MLKTEVICEACDAHFIVVSQDQEPEFCPYCQATLSDDEEE
jgi:peptide methionine sulfoxide reductase MsrB